MRYPNRSARPLLSVVSLTVILAAGSAMAQGAFPTPESLTSPVMTARTNPFEGPTREYQGIPVGGWMLAPQIMIGAAFDSNVYQAANFRQSRVGTRVRPQFTLSRKEGIHNTMIYGNGDFVFYPSESRVNSVLGQAGFAHIYEAQRDLVFRFNGDFSRRRDVGNAGGALTAPQNYNTITGSASAQKDFDRFFVNFGGSVLRNSYEDARNNFGVLVTPGNLRSGTTYTVNGRVGAWISPVFYAFVDPSYNWRDQAISATDSRGYRVTAGFGSEQIGLFKGEVFGGYMQQRYNTAAFGTVQGGVVGTRLYYYPTRDVTLQAVIDRSINDSFTTGLVGNLIPAVTAATSFNLSLNYDFSSRIVAGANVGVTRSDYINGNRVDNRWNAGARLNYFFMRNVAATVEYNFYRTASNLPGFSFDRSVATIGITGRY